MLDALHESAPTESPLSAPSTEPAISWTAAARALGAASDLLATQRDSHGRWRSPEAWLLDEPDVRAAGLREIASVALVVAGAADQLRPLLQDWNVEGSTLAVVPDMARLQVAATATRYLCDSGVESHDLGRMALARPDVRIGDPLIEIADRVERLRCVAWQLTRVRSVGVQTLQWYAALGTIVCAHLQQARPQSTRAFVVKCADGETLGDSFSYGYNRSAAPPSASPGSIQMWLRFDTRSPASVRSIFLEQVWQTCSVASSMRLIKSPDGTIASSVGCTPADSC